MDETSTVAPRPPFDSRCSACMRDIDHTATAHRESVRRYRQLVQRVKVWKQYEQEEGNP